MASESKWHLSLEQLQQLEPFVQGASVLDLGAADLEGSELMLELGAVDVLAVDRYEMPRHHSSAITTWVGYFHDLKETRPVVLASWIVNWPSGVERLIARAEKVISISKNTDGTACGYPLMWEHLAGREILLHVPERQNTLTVYGPRLVHRAPTGEEFAVLKSSRCLQFEAAEEAARFLKLEEG